MPAPFYFGTPDFSELDDLTAPGSSAGGSGGGSGGGGSFFSPDPLSSITPGTLFAPDENGNNTTTPADVGISGQSGIGQAFDDGAEVAQDIAVDQAAGFLFNQASDFVAPVVDSITNSVTGVVNPISNAISNIFTSESTKAITSNLGTEAIKSGVGAATSNVVGNVGAAGAGKVIANNAGKQAIEKGLVEEAGAGILGKASTLLGPLFAAYSTIKALDGRSAPAKGVAGGAAAAGSYYGAAVAGPVGAVIGGALGAIAGSAIAGKHDPRYEVFVNSSGQLVDSSGSNLGNLGELPKADQYYTDNSGTRHLGMKQVPGVNRDGHGVLIDSEGNFYTGEQGSGISKWDTGLQFGPDAIPTGHFQQLNGLSQTSGGTKYQAFDFDAYIEHVGAGGDPADFNSNQTTISRTEDFGPRDTFGTNFNLEDFNRPNARAFNSGLNDAPTVQTAPSQELTLGSNALPSNQRLTTSQAAALPQSAQPTGFQTDSQTAMKVAMDSGPFGFSLSNLRVSF